MSRQDKATTERNARTLRELVKQPDNKSCADCRKNDARWASWNLGVFLCIRCSGIHRSMGTHISKVKSIDLDIWQPEQMESIQKWGNRRANLYWERHLKAGHVPPDHKIESFIRSKYESKRWAMDGPPPSDPSVLEDAAGRSSTSHATEPTATKPSATSSAPPAAPAQGSGSRTHPLLSRSSAHKQPPKATPAAASAPAPVVDLIGGDDDQSMNPAPAAAAASPTNGTASQSPPANAPASGGNIFDLDFRAPTSATSRPQTNKADIMSLFSSTSPTTQPQQSFFSSPNPPAVQNPYASWGGGGTSTNTTQQNPTQSALPTQASNGGWGNLQMDQGAWGGQPQQSQSSMGMGAGQNVWGQSTAAPPAQSPMSGGGGGNLWGGAADPWAAAAAPASVAEKEPENDPFANIWK